MADHRWRRLFREESAFPFWVLAAIVAGAGIGLLTPGWWSRLERLAVGERLTPTALLLLVALTLLMVRVEIELVRLAPPPGRTVALFLGYSWLLRPLLSVIVTLLFLGGLPFYRSGALLLGIAPGFSIMAAWYGRAEVGPAIAASFLAVDTLVALALYPLVLYGLATMLPQWLGLTGSRIDLTLHQSLVAMALYVGVPLLLAVTFRLWVVTFRGWYRLNTKLLPSLNCWVLLSLFLAAWGVFSIQGRIMFSWPWDLVRLAVTVSALSAAAFGLAFWLGTRLGVGYEQTALISLLASSGNWVMAAVMAAALYGATSPQTFVTLLAPMIQIPQTAGLLRLMGRLRKRYYPEGQETNEHNP